MTPENMFSNLQVCAVDILLKETFIHINRMQTEQIIALGKVNAELHKKRGYAFISNGILYPRSNVVEIPPLGHQIPMLHYSLLGELDAINQAFANADYQYVKNFYIAAITQSHNEIVLQELLPTILVNALKQQLTPRQFKMIDTGIYGALQQEPISATKQTIANIKEHYKATMTTIQHLLMDKLLLQA